MTMERMKSGLSAIRPVGHLMFASFLYYGGLVVLLPFLVDILLGALCPGELQCSKVILLMGALQLIAGVGTVLAAPILGVLSDDRGRVPVFKIVFYAAIVPSVLLSYSRSETAVYLWFISIGFVQIVSAGGFLPTVLAYAADVVDESHRSAAVGLIMASLSVGLFLGTTAALVLTSTTDAILVAVILHVSAAVYLTIFVKESKQQQVLPPVEQSQEIIAKLLPKPMLKRQTTKLRETAKTIWTSKQLRTVALVDFLNTFAMTGLQTFALYFLKSVFDYGKDEFAIIVVLAAVGAVLGQMLVYPVLIYLVGERGVLGVGLIIGAGHYFLYGLAWAPWVPYIASGLAVGSAMVSPALGSIVSRVADADEQGKAQGFMGGVRSAGAIIAPLVITPMTASALSDNPPFGTRGIPFYGCGAAMIVAFLISLGLSPLPPPAHTEKPTDYIQVPLPPEDFVRVSVPPADLLHVPVHHEATSS